jgi:hypothetical protein
MFKSSPHFFMEVMLRKLHSVTDKFASLNKEGTVITYTTRDNPRNKQTISLSEGKRIFEDLYGAVTKDVSPQYAALLVKRDLKLKRKAKRTANKEAA